MSITVESMVGDAGAQDANRTPMLFRIGWWVLVVLTALFVLNHVVGVWAFSTSADEQMLFVTFAALGVLSLVVLLIPYRARERWAWWAAWVQVATMALTYAVLGGQGAAIGLLYVAVAALMAAAQFATLPAMRSTARAR